MVRDRTAPGLHSNGDIGPTRSGRGMMASSLVRTVMISIVAAGALLATATAARALTVDSEHPRIIFHADNLPEVRARINGAHSQLFQNYYNWARNRLEAGRRNSYDADDYAAIYLLNGETRFADAAISIAMQMVADGKDLSGEGDGPARSSAVAIVYDWCFDRLSASQKSTIYNALYPNVNVQPDYHQAWFIRDYNWPYMMAIANEGTPAQNAAVIANLEASIDQMENFFLPCLDVSSPQSAIDGYAGLRIMTMLSFLDALNVSTDYQGPALNSIYYRNTGKFWLARYRPDFTWARMPGKYNNSESDPAGYFSYAGSALGDRDAQAMANYLIANRNLGGREATLTLAWHDPNAPANPLSSVSLDYFDPVAGFVLSRTGWNMGPNSTDITVGFFNGTDQVGHGSQNHFFITRGSDNLIVDSGKRFHDLANHYYTYYTRTVAHNAVLIYDPTEDFGSFTNVWGDRIQKPNDGGQRGSDKAEGRERWPECDGLYGYRGEIVRYEATDDYVLVEGDATPSYSSAKAQLVMRRWIFLRPDWVVVQDRVRLARPGLPVRVVYHSVDRPQFDQPLQVVEGVLDKGGVFRSPNARRVTVNRNASSARVYLVEAGGGPIDVRMIGGANASNQNWRQNFQPEDQATYSSSQSFEFWIDGRNWTPGYYVEQSDIDNRNNFEADIPGDWRFEFEVTGNNEVNITTLIHVTAAGAPYAEVTSQPLTDGVSISVRDGGDEFHLALCRPGEECDGLGYTH